MIRLGFICVFLLSVAGAAPLKEGEVEVRLLAERIPRDLGKVVLATNEARSEPADLPMNNLSRPLKPPARAFSVWSVDRNVSIASIQLPEEGNSFIVLLLLPGSEPGYRPVVIPFRDPSFRAGDIYFYNNADKTVVGILGTAKFSLEPKRGKVVRPRGFGDERYYHAMLGVRDGGENKLIKSMKWPSSKTTRNYVFFYMDPVKKRVTYRAVDEFLVSPEPIEETR
ncbi:hypothetical protein [Haloferula sp. A504]|uniref:hypothetical protein n=1 Tax=Haloferula sp. A504 TaxID=3373601 RepID=UPI0031BFC26C|nr:hypothetical protein [Verrucomicrobiaceae bacterium E54]